MAWATNDGDVTVLNALRSRDGVLRPGGGPAVPGVCWLIWCTRPDRNMRGGFHDRGVAWDTPMAKRAGEGKDWVQKK